MACIFSSSHLRVSNPQPHAGRTRCRLGFFIKCDRLAEVTFCAIRISQRRIEVNVVWIKLNRTLPSVDRLLIPVGRGIPSNRNEADGRRKRIEPLSLLNFLYCLL